MQVIYDNMISWPVEFQKFDIYTVVNTKYSKKSPSAGAWDACQQNLQLHMWGGFVSNDPLRTSVPILCGDNMFTRLSIKGLII